jgi:hypothetical protein
MGYRESVVAMAFKLVTGVCHGSPDFLMLSGGDGPQIFLCGSAREADQQRWSRWCLGVGWGQSRAKLMGRWQRGPEG